MRATEPFFFDLVMTYDASIHNLSQMHHGTLSLSLLTIDHRLSDSLVYMVLYLNGVLKL